MSSNVSNQEILAKAIQKAIDGGWVFFEDSTLLPIKDWIVPTSITVWNSYLKDRLHIPQQCVIFNHDFAKTLWGEVEMVEDYFSTGMIPKTPGKKNWVYHLQQMVIAEDPIAYLGDNI